MTCPHCGISIHPQKNDYSMGPDQGTSHWVRNSICPNCNHRFYHLLVGQSNPATGGPRPDVEVVLIYPHRLTDRPDPPASVPEELRQDYLEAARIAGLSPKASAALARRCLQAAIRLKGIKKDTLDKEIDEVRALQLLPPEVWKQLDYVRSIGNFSAHPQKSKQTGEIVDVEEGEALWSLDVLDSLFNYWWEGPAQVAAKKAAFNQKLAAAGKSALP